MSLYFSSHKRDSSQSPPWQSWCLQVFLIPPFVVCVPRWNTLLFLISPCASCHPSCSFLWAVPICFFRRPHLRARCRHAVDLQCFVTFPSLSCVFFLIIPLCFSDHHSKHRAEIRRTKCELVLGRDWSFHLPMHATHWNIHLEGGLPGSSLWGLKRGAGERATHQNNTALPCRGGQQLGAQHVGNGFQLKVCSLVFCFKTELTVQRLSELRYQSTLIIAACGFLWIMWFPSLAGERSRFWRKVRAVSVVVPYRTSLFSKRGDLIQGKSWVDYCSGSWCALCHPGAGLQGPLGSLGYSWSLSLCHSSYRIG